MRTNFRNTVRVATFFSLAAVGLGVTQEPSRLKAQCVTTATMNTPERMGQPLRQSWQEPMNSETWCYEDRSTGDKNLTYIFKPDAGIITPGMSALVERDLYGKIVEISHSSMNKSQVSFHKVDGSFNPLSVPLSLKEALNAGASLTAQPELDLGQTNSELASLETLVAPKVTFGIKSFGLLQGGVMQADLADDKRPYGGFWWNDDGDLFAGPMSPLGKYDAFVKAQTGQDPGSRNWEAQNHSDVSVPWGGHCNGWAASSVLYDEPTKFYWDSTNQNLILPSDIKGMLAESSFCVNWAFYGNRYWGRPGDELTDIHPDLFHKVITYYLGTLQKPVAVDYFRDAEVDNHVYTGYKLTITKVAGSTDQYHVLAEMKENQYDRSRIEEPHRANFFTRNYEYTLTVNANGDIVGGAWISTNPDFLWVPLSPATGTCGWRNPHLNAQKILQISSALPEAKIKKSEINFDINQPIPGGVGHKISIPLTVTRGGLYKIFFSGNTMLDSALYFLADGDNLYPTTGREKLNQSYQSVPQQAAGEVTIAIANISALSLVNYSAAATTGSHFHIDRIEYLSGD